MDMFEIRDPDGHALWFGKSFHRDKVEEELTTKGANVLGTPVSYPRGLRHFEIRDLENNRLSFSQTFEYRAQSPRRLISC